MFRSFTTIKLRNLRARALSKCRRPRWLALKSKSSKLRRKTIQGSHSRHWLALVKRPIRTQSVLRSSLLSNLKSWYSLWKRTASRKSHHQMRRTTCLSQLHSGTIGAFKAMVRLWLISILKPSSLQLKSTVPKSKKLHWLMHLKVKLLQTWVEVQTLLLRLRTCLWLLSFCIILRCLDSTRRSTTAWTNRRHLAWVSQV